MPPTTLPEGLHEALITEGLRREMDALLAAGRTVETTTQTLEWLDEAMSRHLALRLRGLLSEMGEGPEGIAARVALLSRLHEALGSDEGAPWTDAVPAPTAEALTWIPPAVRQLETPKPPARPFHGLVHPALLLGGTQEVQLLHELKAELASADRVDAVLAFLKFSGLRLIEPALRAFLDRGGVLRLITSTYTQATEATAVFALAALGARLRIAYEEEGTRLHAKAWRFERASGLSTAYIGSSNLSRPALTDGQEWNVRVTEQRTPDLLDRLATAFEQLWSSLEEDFSPVKDRERLIAALTPKERGDSSFVFVDVAPKAHQAQTLEALAAERAHGHWRNLVVAATGTGKTWVAAFDYARLRAAGTVSTLLFVAHRREILEQTRKVFRLVLRDPAFGELMVEGLRPAAGRAVFASIQSLHGERLRALPPEAYQMVVVDEVHHATEASYRPLLDHLRPVVLLGLTATPERADGKSLLPWFGERLAAELRLWDALAEGLLVPFHYFGVDDPTSAERAWQRGRIDPRVLDGLYSADDIRARHILAALTRYIGRPDQMRALGFCVGVGHAMRMARAFTEAGLKAEAIHGETPREARDRALSQLESGALRAIFAVDVFNEGVDLPSVDTVLFLRPTESATVFLQQLGRGLRRVPGKAQLTVLDFVGHVHTDYRYELRYQALLRTTRQRTFEAIAAGFPRLPAGCVITLETQAQERVLASARRFVGAARWRGLVADLQRLGPATALSTFLDESGASLEEVYLPSQGRTWGALRRAAGFAEEPERPGEEALRKRLSRCQHVDDDERLGVWLDWLQSPHPPAINTLSPRQRALAWMLAVGLGERQQRVEQLQGALDAAWAHPALRKDAQALFSLLADRSRILTPSLTPGSPVPLSLHGRYSRAEVVAALGLVTHGRLRESREGPLWAPEHDTDVFFVTLDKSDDSFRPSIRYADYPISPREFHWESQNRVHDGTPTGQRYIHHEARGSRVLFFVRERPTDEHGESCAFVCLGFARYLSHAGGRPMRITWALDHAMPAALLQAGRAYAA